MEYFTKVTSTLPDKSGSLVSWSISGFGHSEGTKKQIGLIKGRKQFNTNL